jgi:molybdenum cofactor cytidylyltransferase
MAAMAEADHAAILLAAGASRRLGQPKALLRCHGETLLRRQARLLLATRPRELCVVLGCAAERLRDELDDLPLRVVLAADWAQGMGASLRAGLAALQPGAARVLLCNLDQPRLQHAHLSALLDAAAAAPSGCAATGFGAHAGSPAVVAMPLLTQHPVAAADRGLRGVLRTLPAAQLALLDAPELAFDLDTPGDLALARREGWIDG